MNSFASPGLWNHPRVRAAIITICIGVALLEFAWWRVSGTGRVDEQHVWLNLGIGSVCLIVLGALVGIADARRRVLDRQDRLVCALVPSVGGVVDAVVSGEAPVGAERRLALEGSPLYHQADCMLVKGKETYVLGPTADGAPQRRPCEMCLP